MSRTQEQREAGRLRRERRSQRMAGDALQSTTTDSSESSSPDLSARDEGFRNSLERNLGSEEYGRLGAEGLQGGDNKGRYSAAEVKSEFRNSEKDVEGMTDYFQGLANEGTKFNNRARSFLEGKGVTFGDDIGKPPEPPSDDGGDDTNQPLPTPPEDGNPSPQPPVVAPGIPSPFGNSQTQVVTQDNDQTSTVNGDNNTVNQNQDNSVSQSMSYGSGGSFKDSWMKNYFK